MTVRLTAAAANDLREARDHCRVIDREPEARFLDQLDVTVDRLLAFLRGAPPVEGIPGVRRARMRRFPYGVFYRVEADDIVVLRVLHRRRDAPDLL